MENPPGAREILIVDDHQVVREGIRSLIATMRPQWSVSEAENGTEAMGMIEERKPDLVIMDITMPDVSGLEITSRLRNTGFDRPILMFTMHSSPLLTGETQHAGAQGYVLKSQAVKDLIDAIDALLGGGTFFGSPDRGGPAPEKAKPSSLLRIRLEPAFLAQSVVATIAFCSRRASA